MNTNDLREEIKLRLTGGILELELDDTTIDRLINSSLREVQRYINTTKLITIPYSKCIDLKSTEDPLTKNNIKVNAIVGVYRTHGSTDNAESTDPMMMSMWQMLGGYGNGFDITNYTYNYLSYNTLNQIRNTLSSDLSYVYDKPTEKLYINSSTAPKDITIEYVPRFDSVEEITSDYWVDILVRLAVASAKVIVGRIRSRYTQANALWTQDGETILAEGITELTELREHLKANEDLLLPID